MSIFAELFEFLGARKKFWLLPLLALFLIFGGLFVLSEGSVVAPFIYTLFWTGSDYRTGNFRLLSRQRRSVLIRNGEIIAAAQEERFTRKKHDPDFPRRRSLIA